VKLRSLAEKILTRVGWQNYHKSYSQMGEDLIIAYHLKTRGFHLGKIRYLDIGACAPTKLSNTYYFYKQGSSGVLVEPDKCLTTLLRRDRPRDHILNVGISKEEKDEADFYVTQPPTLNSFSKEMADFVNSEEGRKAYGQDVRVKEVRKVNLVNINTIMKSWFNNAPPEILSIDAEGLDWEILSSLNFDLYSPYCVCIEVNQHYEEVKNLLEMRGYCMIGYNQLNVIFMKHRQCD